ncbi:MAG: YceG family protein [Culicoidibacterales bacterium]
MQIPDWQIDLARFEELFPLNSTSRAEILNNETPGYFSGRMLGCFEDEDHYFNLLYDYSLQVDLFVLHQFNIQSHILSSEQVSSIQQLLQTGKPAEPFVVHLLGQNILPLPAQSQFHEFYYQAYVTVFETLLGPSGMTIPQIIEIISYLQRYLNVVIARTVPTAKCIWYGPMTYAQAGFLAVWMQLHFDVLIFAPDQTDWLHQFFPDCNQWSHMQKFPNCHEVIAFPTKRRAVVATTAQQASNKLEQLLDDGISGLYRPWQLRNYQTKSLHLTTTFAEVALYLGQQAPFRPGFHVEKGIVSLPVLLTKINGVETPEQLSELIQLARALPNTIILEQFPFMSPILMNYEYYLAEIESANGQFVPEYMMKAIWWRYQSLSIALQKKLTAAMISTLEDINLHINSESKREQQGQILGTLIDLPDPFIQQLEQFDYAREVPKVLTIHSQVSGLLSAEDAIVLRFLHHLGYDIISLNPSSRSDLDRFLAPEAIQIHQLPHHWFEYPQPKASMTKQRKWFWRK